MGFAACHESLFLVLGVDSGSMAVGRLLRFLLLFGVVLLLWRHLLMLVLGLFFEGPRSNGGSCCPGR
jgi:hypothetical protein